MAKSLTGLTSMFTTLSLNATASNQSLAGTLLNDNHRYLLQKYFDNEKSFFITTIGPQSLTLTTATLANGSTSATLTSAWTYSTISQLVVFSDGEQYTVNFTQNSTSINWSIPTTAVQTSATISCVGVQSYPMPANVSKLKNSTITIGQLVYTPAPVQSIQEWTKLNALPYTSSIPAYFFVYDNHLQFWPIPAATGEVITLYAQISVADMTYQDYTTGTITTMASGSNAIVGSGTSWNTTGHYPLNTDLTFANLFLSVAPPQGDGLYYQIQSFQSDTTLTLLKSVVNAPAITSANYTIGQYPLLFPDFHDILVYWALSVYYTSIVKDTDRKTMYESIYQNKLEMMKGYLSTKQVNVDPSVTPTQTNPNLYFYAPPQ